MGECLIVRQLSAGSYKHNGLVLDNRSQGEVRIVVRSEERVSLFVSHDSCPMAMKPWVARKLATIDVEVEGDVIHYQSTVPAMDDPKTIKALTV